MSRLLVALPGAALAVAAAGCNVFDPALYQNRPAPVVDAAPVAPDAEADSGAPDLAPGPDLSPTSVFADRCVGLAPTMSSSAIELDLDTNDFNADFSELVACTGHDLPGKDAFLSFEMTAGQRWHVHVTPLAAEFDPAVYILTSCDQRACSRISAIDECGQGKSEHLSFLAPQNGTYFVGIDSRSGAGRARVLILRPTCGNGAAEHSETCDDGNTTPGDGCDAWCRKEFTTSPITELEPNDDPRAANVLAGKSIIAMGVVASRCDHDMYSVSLTQQGTLRATVSATTAPCGLEGAPLNLTLIGADGLTAVPGVTTTVNNDCPAIEAQNLPPGEYYVVLRRLTGEMSWPYQMLVETP